MIPYIHYMKHIVQEVLQDIREWSQGWWFYLERHAVRFGKIFESKKDILVDILMARRGTYQWPFLHISLILLAIAGAASAPILASSYPGAIPQTLADFTPPSAVAVTLDPNIGVDTQVSDKPRDQVITYEVQKGDTLKKIADQFGISVDTIKWANDLTNVNAIKPGQTLKILPVSGVAHTVKSGDTLVSVAKKYSAEQQPMVDFPFNDIPDDLSLKVGQVLIIPDGVPPQAPITSPSSRRAPQFLAQGPASQTFSAPGGGSFVWPTNGIMTQYFSWYHPGIDIAVHRHPGEGYFLALIVAQLRQDCRDFSG